MQDNLFPNRDQPNHAHKRGPRKSKRQAKKHNFKFGYINANGVRSINKWHEIESTMNKLQLTALFITETHLRDAETPETSNNLKWIGHNRTEGDKKGGGLGILINIHMEIKETRCCTEHTWVILQPTLAEPPIAIAVVYMATRDTRHDNDLIRTCLGEDIQKWSDEGIKNILIFGDFNAHIRETAPNEDAEGTKLKEFAHRFNLSIVNNLEVCEGTYTWQRGNHKSAIDYVLASHEALSHITSMTIDELGEHNISSDHNLITLEYNTKKNHMSRHRQDTRLQHQQSRWKLHNEEALKCFSVTIEQALQSTPDIQYDDFIELLRATGLKTCGKTIENPNGKCKKPKWLTPEVREAIKNRQDANKAHRQAIKRGTDSDISTTWRGYKHKKRTAHCLIKQEMRKIDKHMVKELLKNNKQAVKKFWRYLKRNNLQSKNTRGLRNGLGQIIDNPQEIKNILEQHFQRQNPQAPMTEAPVHDVRQQIPPFSLKELTETITRLPNGKATGLDDIPNEFLKCLGERGQTVLLSYFNSFLQGNPLPHTWKTAKIKLVHKGKNKDPNDITSYRPISLLSNMYKCFVTILKIRMTDILEDKKCLGDIQYGFRKNRSTNDGLFLLSQTIECAQKQNKQLYAALLDIKTAYDTVNRPQLWSKLDDIGLPRGYTQLLQDIYQATESIYEWEGIHSKKIHSAIGLRQGCPLSSLLFILYIAELEHSLNKENKGYNISDSVIINGIFYADDVILFADNAIDLQKQLDIASTFANTHHLEFSATKSEIIIFNKQQTEQPNFLLQDKPICIKEEVTYLGIRFCSEKNYLEKETQYRFAKANRQKFAVFAHSRMTFNRYAVARTLWKQVATPTLTYAHEVLPFPQELWQTCDKHQLEVGKYAVGANHLTPHITIEGELGWSSFKLREARAKNCYAGHLLRNDKQSKLRQMHDITRNQQLNTTWHKQLYSIRRKYNLGTNITRHPDKTSWNKDTIERLNEENEKRWRTEVNKKTSLNRYQQKQTIARETLYDNTLGSDLLYQARTGSLPTAHRHSEIFKDDPMCKLCGAEVEDIPHILTQCPILTQARERIFSNNNLDPNEMLGLTIPQNTEQTEKTKRLLEEWWSISQKPYPYWRKWY